MEYSIEWELDLSVSCEYDKAFILKSLFDEGLWDTWTRHAIWVREYSIEWVTLVQLIPEIFRRNTEVKPRKLWKDPVIVESCTRNRGSTSVLYINWEERRSQNEHSLHARGTSVYETIIRVTSLIVLVKVVCLYTHFSSAGYCMNIMITTVEGLVP